MLVCDDHRMFAEALAALLEGRGYEIAAVVTAPADAVEVARSRPVELCVLDLRFPGGDGLAAIAAVRAARPAAHVVVLSGSNDEAFLGRAVLAGASAVAHKSEGIDRIVEVLERVGRGQVATPAQPPKLTPRELQVLEGIARGEATAALACRLGMRYSTARTHIRNVLVKLGVHSKLEAVAVAVERGLAPAGAAPAPPSSDRRHSTG